MAQAYSINSIPSTSGSAIVRSGLLSSLLLGCAGAMVPLGAPAVAVNHYEVREFASTSSAANQYHFLDSADLKVQKVDFEGSVSHFYAKLKADQEPLGEVFEKVLAENLWDLYSRT
jgi:hypothetical protein